MEERILCASIWYKDFPLGLYQPNNIDSGIVLSGHRHACIIQQHVILCNKRSCEMGEHIQGFLTNLNRFVDREEGLVIALEANQVLDLKEVRGNILFSEDLY